MHIVQWNTQRNARVTALIMYVRFLPQNLNFANNRHISFRLIGKVFSFAISNLHELRIDCDTVCVLITHLGEPGLD